MYIEITKQCVTDLHRGVSESQHLKQIHINEAYPELTAQKQEAEAKKQLLSSSKATIAYTYEGEGSGSNRKSGSKVLPAANETEEDGGRQIFFGKASR